MSTDQKCFKHCSYSKKELVQISQWKGELIQSTKHIEVAEIFIGKWDPYVI